MSAVCLPRSPRLAPALLVLILMGTVHPQPARSAGRPTVDARMASDSASHFLRGASVPSRMLAAAENPATTPAPTKPNRRRGVRLLLGAGLALCAFLILLIGVVMIRSFRQR